MAGVRNAILSGWRVPVVYWPVADHTYVESDCGMAWDCCGNRTGGAIVSNGTGDSTIAACIAEPDGMAGIRWNLNGWCHQIANRILHPAGITVAGVRGYAYSRFKFGAYGRNLPPPNLSSCYGAVARPRSGPSPTTADMASFLRASAPWDRSIAEVARMDDFPGPDRVQELADLIRSTPGLVLSERQFAALSEVQGRLWASEDGLGALLEGEEISPEAFAERSIELTAASMRECEAVIGAENYSLLFGEAGRSPEGIMDRDLFVSTYEGQRSDSATPSL